MVVNDAKNYYLVGIFLLSYFSTMAKVKFTVFLVMMITVVVASSCNSGKQLAYFKDLSDTAMMSKINTLPYVPLKLQPDDDVQVIISSPAPEASQFFNILTMSTATDAAASTMNPTQAFLNNYKISSDGFITMPVLGNIQAAGLTIEQLKSSILVKLKDYLKDPVISARITNFKVTVIGEVGQPVVIPVTGQTINILEAVGAAGDLTEFGIRKNVRVIRKLADGTTEIAVLNFNKASVLQSPYFQLRQNDIVYVEAAKNKAAPAAKATMWVGILTAVMYTAAIFITR